MNDVSSTIQEHYSQGTLMARILSYLADQVLDADNLTPENLHNVDQLHGRGVASTVEHIKFAKIKSAMHVLDLGCGIGGSSRFLASASKCRVTGIDLTQEFIDVAEDLTRRCALDSNITFQQGNALDLPFADASFDHVWCHNVTMNIEDKVALAAEIARVLKPGGRFSCAEVGLGPNGEPEYPLPWARQPSSSFLVTPDDMCTALEDGGLRIIKRRDDTETTLADLQEVRARAQRGKPPLQANQIVMGDDFPDRARNAGRMTTAGRLVAHMVLAEKR